MIQKDKKKPNDKSLRAPEKASANSSGESHDLNKLGELLEAWPDSEEGSDVHIGAIHYNYGKGKVVAHETTPPSSFQEEVTKPHGRAPVPTPSITPKVRKFFTVAAVVITGIAGLIKLVYELVQGVHQP
jgi:hypothetical protein